ncbi:MAG: hypothetical protein JOY89_14685 [Solirubrobacterales bacterium]|nr:hypothetical protein [Solirubrobacterales bacterium]
MWWAGGTYAAPSGYPVVAYAAPRGPRPPRKDSTNSGLAPSYAGVPSIGGTNTSGQVAGARPPSAAWSA